MTDQPVQSSVIERNGITTRRDHYDDNTDHVKAAVTGSGATISMTPAQAHELLDQLAWQLGRPDIIERHRHKPERREQPSRRT